MSSTITAILERMSLPQKVGQVMAIGFDGTEAGPELVEMLTGYAVGGVILFARNVESPAQVARLTNALQAAARARSLPGLLLAIDQEGGRVARLTEDKGFTEFPSAMALGAAGASGNQAASSGPENAFQAARAIASELRAVGLNTDFAPVLDVNNNTANPVIGTRAFGFDPAQVAACGVAFLNGLQKSGPGNCGILACGKHFPGHGDTAQDSHFGLPVVTHDRQRLEATEFVPFRAAIKAGVGALMSAHIRYPALDPDSLPEAGRLPATLSPRVMTDLARQELGFTGLLATDSLEMGALASSGYPVPLAAAMALQAGADLLLFNRDHALHRQAHAMVMEWVEAGKIPLSRLEEAARRVLETKQRFGMLDPIPVDPLAAGAACGTAEHRELSRALACQALRRKPGAVALPLSKARVLAVPGSARLVQRLGLPSIPVTDNPGAEEIAALLRQIKDTVRPGEPLVVTLYDARFRYPGQMELLEALIAQGLPMVVVALGSPFDLEILPENVTGLAAYGNNPPAIKALANAIGANSST